MLLRNRGQVGSHQGLATWGSSLIQSVQSGSITLSTAQTTNTATITAVDTNNAMLCCGGLTHIIVTSTTISDVLTRLDLTNATTVTATRNDTNTGTSSCITPFIVIEFKPGVLKSVQRGTITIAAAAASNTATVTAIDTAKTLLLCNGWVTSATRTEDAYARVVLTNATTITATRSGNTLQVIVGYDLVEFY